MYCRVYQVAAGDPLKVGLRWLLGALLLSAVGAASAREIGIGFIDDGDDGATAPLAELVIRELEPLLRGRDTVNPIRFQAGDGIRNPAQLHSLAVSDPDVDYIVATGFLGSQEIAKQSRFGKPTYLLRVLDPTLTGAPDGSTARNVRHYTQVNLAVNVFERVRSLFGAERVGLLRPASVAGSTGELDAAIRVAAEGAGVTELVFVAPDFARDLAPQIPDIDALILPPIALPDAQLERVLLALQRKRIPSYAVGGDSMVRQGALISDTVAKDDRVLARRVALDLQLAITGQAATRGVQLLQSQKDTTINIDTARALGVDLSFDELTTARLVQRSLDQARSLEYLGALELGSELGLGLRDSRLQLAADRAALAQSRAVSGPQLAAQLSHTRRGEQLPNRDSLAVLSASQSLYSLTNNAAIATAELTVAATHIALDQATLDTVTSVSAAYFAALETQAQLASRLRDLTLNRENLNLAERRERSGSGSRADVYRWQSLIASSENAAQQAFTANLNAQSQLAELLNTRLQLPVTLADVTLDQPPFDLLHEALEPFLFSTGRAERLREATTSRALSRSLQVGSSENAIELTSVQLDAQRRGYYTPELSLSAQVSRYLDSSANTAGVTLDGESDWSASVTASLQLWDSGSRANRLRQLAAQRDQASVNLERTRTGLWRDSLVTVNDLIANFRAIAINAKAVEAAWKSLQITQESYRLGSATVTDLLDTQTTFREAEDNANIARYQYLNSLVSFQALMGEMPMLLSGTEQQQWLDSLVSLVDSLN